MTDAKDKKPDRKVSLPQKYHDRLFAPSSCLAMITTVDGVGRVNAAAFGTCTRVHHNPVYIAFATTVENDTANNVIETGEFVVNLPAFDEDMLGKVMVVGLPFAKGDNELMHAGLTAIGSDTVRPPRILECPRHFECKVDWTKEWSGGRLMVCGLVSAASADADCIDAKGYINWAKVRPAHYCGAPYGNGNMFVKAYETVAVDVPYRGRAFDQFDAIRKSFFDDM
ncbi:MAG: flavin reductase family protein [Pseudomonadota bacterium]